MSEFTPAFFFFFSPLHSMFTVWKPQDCILNVSVFYGPIQDLFFLCVEHSQSSVAFPFVVKKSVSMEVSSDSLQLKVLL